MNIAFLSALNFLVRTFPCHLLAYYPYHDRLRFPAYRIVLIIVAIQLTQAALYGASVASGLPSRRMEYVFALFYMALFFLFVRADRAKLLFLYLFVTDYTLVLRALPLFLEAHFTDKPLYFCVYDIALSFALSATTLPFILTFFSHTKERVFQIDAPDFWRTAWWSAIIKI